VLKIIRTDIPPASPEAVITAPSIGNAGETLQFSAAPSTAEPVLQYLWDFGDGTSLSGKAVDHAYTHAGNFHVRLRAIGLGGSSSEQTADITIHGEVSTKYVPQQKRRFQQP
jgi:chitinase